MNQFFETNGAKLQAFSEMSRATGARADYVQGGGGNTSVKLEGGLMAIKASGFHLSDVRPDSGYAVLDYVKLKAFYLSGGPADYADVEQAGAAKARENTVEIPGLAPLRPSVEAGFHSLLSTFVNHSHSVYANLAACSDQAERVIGEALSRAPYSFAVVPYVNPGALLTFHIRDAVDRVREETGKEPSVILLRSHGLITHAETAEDCLRLHEDANRRFMDWFGVSRPDFPAAGIKQTDEGFESDTPWLRERLRGDSHPDSALLDEPLYPDQLVFFQGTLGVKALIDRQTGRVSYHGLPEKSARTLEETLCAVVFIRETLLRRGLRPVSMGEAARAFIASWESEKYRKSLAEKK